MDAKIISFVPFKHQTSKHKVDCYCLSQSRNVKLITIFLVKRSLTKSVALENGSILIMYFASVELFC